MAESHATRARRARSMTGLSHQIHLNDRASATSGEDSTKNTGSSTSSGNTSALFGLGEAARIFQETVFGVVAVMSRGAQRQLTWAVIEAAIVSIQFLLFPMQLFSWEGLGALANPVRDILRIAIPFRLSSLRYDIFLAVFWTSAALVAVCIATASYVGFAFAKQDFRFMFPLRFLHFAVSRCVGLLYMPLISVFSAAYNCPLPSPDRPALHRYFPEHIVCWTGPHVPLLLVSLVASALFTAFAFVSSLLFFEPDCTKVGPEGEREYFSRPHSRVDSLFLLNNVLLSILVNLAAIPNVLMALILTASGAAFLYLTLAYYPYHRLVPCMHNAGVFAAFTYASFLCVLDAHYAERLPALSVAFLAGSLPAYLAGYGAACVRFRLRMCTGGPEIVERIKSPLHVEIATRFVYAAKGPEAEAAVETANAIFRAGVEKFPGSANVLLAYATFCMGVLHSPELAYEKVQQASKLHPAFDMRFIIYQYELERQQKAHAIDLGDAKRDLIAHIEYTSNLTGARKYHKAAVRALRKFWGLLAGDPHDLDIKQLESTLARIDNAERRAHAHYRALLSRHPRAPRILRAYGRFQADVLNDEGEASALFEQADMYEEARGDHESEPGGPGGPSRGSSAYGPSRGASMRAPRRRPPGQGAGSGGPTLRGLAAGLLSDLAASLRSGKRVRPEAPAPGPEEAAPSGVASLAPPPGEAPTPPPAPSPPPEPAARREPKRTSFRLQPGRESPSPHRRSRLPELQLREGPAEEAGRPAMRRRRRSASLQDDEGEARPAEPAQAGMEATLAALSQRSLPPVRAPLKLRVHSLAPEGEGEAPPTPPAEPHSPAESRPASLAGMPPPAVVLLDGRSPLNSAGVVSMAHFLNAAVGAGLAGLGEHGKEEAPASPRARAPDAATDASGAESVDEVTARRRKLRRWTRIKRRVQSAGDAHASSIRRMKYVVVAVLLAIAALAVVSFVVIDVLVGQYDVAIEQVAESGKRRKDGALAAFHAQGLLLAGTAWDPDGRLEPRARAGLALAAAELERYHVSLYKSGARVPEDTEPRIQLEVMTTDTGETARVPTTLWTAGLQLASNAERVANMSLAALRDAGRPQRELYFVKENGPIVLYAAFLAATTNLDLQASGRFAAIRLFLDLTFVVVTLLLLLLALGFFRPTVASVQREKAAAIALFREIPPAAIRTLAAAHRRRAAADPELEGDPSDDDLFDDVDADGAHDHEEAPAPRAGQRRSGSVDDGGSPHAHGAPAGGPARRARRRLARAWRAVRKRLGTPDRVTVMYGTAFAAVFSVFLAWFAVGMITADTCEHFSAERNFAGALRSLPARIHYHAREMATSPADYDRQRAFLSEALDLFETVHKALLFGNASMGLPGALHRYAPHDALLFGPGCLAAECGPGAPPAFRGGLEKLALRFAEEARLLLTTPRDRLGPASEHLQFIEAVNLPALQPSLQAFADLFVAEAYWRLDGFEAAQAWCFGAVLALLAAEYVLVFRRIVSGLNDESRRTVFMFLMLPPDVIEATESIKAHLARLVSTVAAGEEA